MTPAAIEDTIRAAAALTAALAADNLDAAEALDRPGPSWALAVWLARALESAGTDPAEYASAMIADSIAYESGRAA
jgi:hypothetical protein